MAVFVRKSPKKQIGRRKGFPLETEVSWFVLVSILDIVTTFLALRYSAEGRLQVTIIESNPIAHWILSHWGIPGMTIFKLAMTGLVVAIAIGIESRRPVVSRLLLWGGTAVVTSVVIYSTRLILQHQ